MSLYVDDLLLFIVDPLNSLPHAFSIFFKEFGDISGYKLNMLKSECLIINSYARELSFQTFPFKIKTDYLTYLGIKVTCSHKRLFEANFSPLLEHTKADFQRLGNLPLLLTGRINAAKMSTLPKFLYFFQ